MRKYQKANNKEEDDNIDDGIYEDYEMFQNAYL